MASIGSATARTRPHRRGATAVVAGAFWATMVGTTIPTPLYPRYEAAFGFSSLMVTVAFAVYALGVVAGLLCFGSLSDRLGRRPVTATALLLAIAAAGVFLAADGLGLLLFGRVLSGLAAALVTGAATAHLTELAAPDRQVRAGRIALAANMGGLAGGPLLAGFLAQWAPDPLRLVWRVDAALVLVALLLLAGVPETVTRRAGSRLFALSLPRIPADLRTPFLHCALAAGSGFAVLGVLTATTGLFFAQVLSLSTPALSGATVAIAFVCTGLGQLLARGLASRRVLPTACLGLLAAAALIATAMLTATLAPLMAAAVIVGLATGLAVGAGIALITEHVAPAVRGQAFSALFAVLYAMLALPAIGVGVLITATGLRTAGAVFAAVVAALVLGVLARLPRARDVVE
ncbi:MFS transporter [Kitasatospora sp. GAS204B]|uniref:MFS transporter n=1 Tax=unclassified Kitasatospora TaxID=2633591 RepID=UPI002476C9D1|nr:MFS transporter [Kitasatospora sp. GAS204B]MDH6117478.1 MFS family permease [Kitasatospora sp. GAS204B]